MPGIDALPLTGQYTTYSLQKGTGDNPTYQAAISFNEDGSGLATGRRQYTVKFVSANHDLAGSESAPTLVQVFFYDPPNLAVLRRDHVARRGRHPDRERRHRLCPAESVSRQAMAAFLYRLAG